MHLQQTLPKTVRLYFSDLLLYRPFAVNKEWNLLFVLFVRNTVVLFTSIQTIVGFHQGGRLLPVICWRLGGDGASPAAGGEAGVRRAGVFTGFFSTNSCFAAGETVGGGASSGTVLSSSEVNQ